MPLSAIFKYSNRRFFTLGLIAAASLYGLTHSVIHLKEQQEKRRNAPFFFAGMKFSGLESLFVNTRYIGYYTDRDMTKDKNLAQFEQAQLVLAPVILDLNNTAHHFVLFDCDDEKRAFEKIKEINGRPIKRNNLGVILAVTPSIL